MESAAELSASDLDHVKSSALRSVLECHVLQCDNAVGEAVQLEIVAR